MKKLFLLILISFVFIAPTSVVNAQMMGSDGNRQMHITMGKRLSGCEPNAAFPSQGYGWMPMMQMMGGWSSPLGFLGFGYGFGFLGWLFMLFWWVLIIVAVVALIKWLANQYGN